MHLKLALPPGYRRREILAFHARDPQGAAELVEPNRLRKGLLIDGRPTILDIQFHDTHAVCDADTGAPLTDIACRLLGLSLDPSPFESAYRHDPLLGPLIRTNAGLRLPQSATPFEALTWAIIGQHINVRFAITLRRTLIQLAGTLHPSGLWCYPHPEAVASLDPQTLGQHKFSRAKAGTLIRVARLVASGELSLEYTANTPAVLLAIPGIGPWTVNYALLRGFAHPDCSLHGDVAVRNALQQQLGLPAKPSIPEAERLLLPYQPYRSLAAAHLWASLPAKNPVD